MAPTTPIIDPRNFQDLVDEAKRRIPQYCPEWTDHNVADPGVTLIELFAWMADILLYRLNKVPERDYLKFLELIGARPRAAVPASAELTFWLTAPLNETKVVRRGVSIATRESETRPAINFTTDAELRVLPPDLKYCILARRKEDAPGDGYAYEDVSSQLAWDRSALLVFQEQPREGDTFYLGFTGNMAGHILRLNLRCETLRAPNINQDDPPIVWEFWNGDGWASLLPNAEEVALLRQIEPDCSDLGPRLDNTRGLNRDGRVILVVPRTCVKRELRVDTRALEACWIRCRAARRHPNERFYDRSPVVNGVSVASVGGMVTASHSEEIVGEVLGRSDGTPAQRFTVMRPPLLPRIVEGSQPETVEVEAADGSFERWTEVETFADSQPTDSHFVVNDLTGEICFGPRLREPTGEERQYGRVPPKERLIRFSRYRSGGGAVGNTGRGTIVVPKSATDMPYVKWVNNLRSATGGRDRESIEQFMIRGPKLVRTREVAVTAMDFEFLAREASPQAARVYCVPADPPNGSGPRFVRLLLIPAVPTTDEYVPRGQLELTDEARRELFRRVKSYLTERCPLTTEVVVGLPDYQWVSVRAKLVIRTSLGQEAASIQAERARIEAEAARHLYRFIHPVTGGADGKGWPFGKALTLGDVYPLVQSVPGVEYVEEVRFRPVTFGANGEQRLGNDERLIRVPNTAVLCSGVHEIEVVAE